MTKLDMSTLTKSVPCVRTDRETTRKMKNVCMCGMCVCVHVQYVGPHLRGHKKASKNGLSKGVA